jgi:hypothetical protein
MKLYNLKGGLQELGDGGGIWLGFCFSFFFFHGSLVRIGLRFEPLVHMCI